MHANRHGPPAKLHELVSLVIACAAAVSSPEVATSFFDAIYYTSTRGSSATVNSSTWGSAGAVPVIVAAMAAHGACSELVAAKGCSALTYLAYSERTFEEEPAQVQHDHVFTTEGLDAIFTVMASHPISEAVQREACYALLVIVGNVGRAGITVARAATAANLLNTAKAIHPLPGQGTVAKFADDALAALLVI